MKYRRLGRTGFEVSQISLGTVEIGMPYGIAENGCSAAPDESAAARLLNRALDFGVNFIDTARAYGDSEAIIGRNLRRRRQEFFLTSKVMSPHGENLGGTEIRQLTTDSVHESLRLLRTDYIDLMMIHCRADEIVPDQAVFETLQSFKEAGSIRTIGASVYGEDAPVAAIRHGGFDCLQIAYSALDRRLGSGLFALAEETDVGLVARSVLLKGVLTDRYRHLPEPLADLKARVHELKVLASREEMSLPELAYRFVLSQEMPQTALVGTSSIDELEEVVRFAENVTLSDDQMMAIRSIPMPDARDLNPGNWPSS
jgi:aryl-alcohol dehydrogenase-like predicted oxidoreductase